MRDPFAVAKSLLSRAPFPDKQKITIPDLIARFPNGVTVNDIRDGNGEYGHYLVLAFAEDEQSFFYANSGDLEKLANAWVEEFGSVDDAAQALQHNPVKIKVSRVSQKNRKGAIYTRVDLVDPDLDNLPF